MSEAESAALPEPTTDVAKKLRKRVPAARWGKIVAVAVDRAKLLDEVAAMERESGLSKRRSLEAVAPEVDWSTYLHIRRKHAAGKGPSWERLLDGRIPPEPFRVPVEVRKAACMLRRAVPGMSYEAANAQLVKSFGETGRISDSSLGRIWRQAGLVNQLPREGFPEKIVEYNGGAGLAFLGAADLETGVSLKMAEEVLEAGVAAALEQGDVEEGYVGEVGAGRDERGRLTAEYNRTVRAAVPDGEVDSRWNGDSEKRQHRSLAGVALLRSNPETVAHKLLSIGAVPLLSERRGFDGLESPAGAWQELMGGWPYMPATLDKALAEMALLDVGDALWTAHGEHWREVSAAWAGDGPSWLRWALYVDATQDPYWTRRFAASGKVSRVGRVMPCLTRVAVMAGPGVPLLVETRAGSVSLSKELPRLLDRMESIVGEGEIGRLTVVDAEMATAGLLTTLASRKDRWFVTVLKGSAAKGKELEEPGRWEPYRERDRIREGAVRLRGKGAPEDGLRLRCVEMVREGSRDPRPTRFMTNAAVEVLSTPSVPTAYLSRWPCQEQRFRDGRNGGGLNRSHGYGGKYVTHVALDKKIGDAERAALRVSSHGLDAEERLEDTKRILSCVPAEERPAAWGLAKQARRDLKRLDKELDRACDKVEAAENMPREIYTRDTTRDSIATCTKLTVMMLLEFVLKEYFGGLRMEWRMFIETFVALPVQVATSYHRVVFRIRGNPRQPKRTAELVAACAEVTRRKLRRDGRLVVFEVVDQGG